MKYEDETIINDLPFITIKSNNNYKANCVLCDDKKRRMYFLYNQTTDTTGVYCHNCNYSASLKSFLYTHYPEYLKTGYINVEREVIDFKKAVNQRKKKLLLEVEEPKNCIKLAELPKDHKAVQYIIGRKIPSKYFSELYYAEDFREVASNYKYDVEKWIKEDRLIIPFRHHKEITYIQGRSFSPTTKLRYITLECKKDLKIWGLDDIDKSNRVYITEGPIDAMFLNNSMAMAGSSVSNTELLKLLKMNPKDIVFVYDNEPNNLDIRKQIKDKIDFGFSIVIWDNNRVDGKDINEMILNDFDVTELNNMIYHSNLAIYKFSRWM